MLTDDITIESNNSSTTGRRCIRVVREKHNNLVGLDVGNITINADGYKITAKNFNEGIFNVQFTDSDRDITIMTAVMDNIDIGNNLPNRQGVTAFEVKNGNINLINCKINIIEETVGNSNYGVFLTNASENVTFNISNCEIASNNAIRVNNSKNCTFNRTDTVFKVANSGYCISTVGSKNIKYLLNNTTCNLGEITCDDGTTQNVCTVTEK